MTIQRSVSARDAANNAYSTTLGTTGVTLTLFAAPGPPASCALADTGTPLVVMTLPSSPLVASSGGVISKTGSWSGVGIATGIAVYYRMKSSGGAVIEQGTVAMVTTLTTSALTAANGNVLTFASPPTGLINGQTISGTGIPTNTLILAIIGSTVIMSHTSSAGVASGATITFGADQTLDNTSIAINQGVSIAVYSITAGDA